MIPLNLLQFNVVLVLAVLSLCFTLKWWFHRFEVVLAGKDCRLRVPCSPLLLEKVSIPHPARGLFTAKPIQNVKICNSDQKRHANLLATELAWEVCSTFRFFDKDGSRVETKMSFYFRENAKFHIDFNFPENCPNIFIFAKAFAKIILLFSVLCKNSSNFCNEQFFSSQHANLRHFPLLFSLESAKSHAIKIFSHKWFLFFARICKISCYQNIFTKMVPSSSMLLTNLVFSGLNLGKN